MLDVICTRRGEAEVNFSVPGACGARAAAVVGEFNEWSPTAHPMTRGDDGFFVTLTLPTGRTYRFRYLLDGERLQNDWAADAYVPNEHGGDDSELDLRVTRPTTVRERPERQRRCQEATQLTRGARS